MAPVMLATQSLDVLLQQSAHAYNALSHPLDLFKPLLVELRVVQDLRRDTGTVDRRVRV